MFRIDDPTAASSAPAVPTVGTPGYFTKGNPGLGVPATLVPDWWLNQVQEELMSVITAGSVVPAKGTNNQVLQALINMFPGISGGGRSVTGPGYIFLPGGLVLQWIQNVGLATDSSGQAAYTWTYPIALLGGSLGAMFTGTHYGFATNTVNVVHGGVTTSAGHETGALLYASGGTPSSAYGLGISALVIGF